MSHGWQPSGDGGGRGGGLDGFLTRLSNRRPQALGATSNSNAAGDNMGNHSYRPAPSYPPPAPFLPSLYAGQEDNISLDGFGTLKPKLYMLKTYRITQIETS